MQHRLVRQRGERRVAVHDVHLLPDEDVPQEWQRGQHGRQHTALVECLVWAVIHLCVGLGVEGEAETCMNKATTLRSCFHLPGGHLSGLRLK